MTCSNYGLFNTLPEISADQMLKFDHTKLVKIQKKLSKFLNTCMSRLDLVGTRCVEDFLNLDITGTLTLAAVTTVPPPHL